MQYRMIAENDIGHYTFKKGEMLIRVSDRVDDDGCHEYQNVAGTRQWLSPHEVEPIR